MSGLGDLEIFPRDVIIHMLERFDKKPLCVFSECCKKARELMLACLPRTKFMDIAMIKFCGRGYKLFFELYDKWENPSYNNNYAIGLASCRGHLKVVELLLKDERVDPNADHYAAIRWASVKGRLKVVRLLMNDPRISESPAGRFAAMCAREKGHTDIVELLEEKGFSLRMPSLPSEYSEYGNFIAYFFIN